MSINIKELGETLKARHDDMVGNRMLTNELIVDDIMVELGYNKKRDTGVKRLYTGKLDWEITVPNGKRIAVKVFAIDEEVNTEELNDTISFCKEKRFSILLVINGESITVYRYNKEALDYTKVITVSILEELTEQNNIILDAISKDNFNLEVIDSMLKNVSVTLDDVRDIYVEHKIDIQNMLTKWIKAKITDCNNADEQSKLFIDSLDKNEVQDNKEYIVQIQELLDKNGSLTAEIEKLKSESKAASEPSDITEKIMELESKIEELLAENTKLKESQGIAKDVEGETEDQDKYVYMEQIRDLTIKLSDETEKVENLTKELDATKAELNNMSGAERKRALELLAVIEDNPELDRHYVAVINTELMQFEELHKFVGRCLQKLYEIKSFEASQYIFNGGIFTLNANAKNNDIMMNNKTYDIELGDIHEDEALNKLRIVFSHFDDVIFECKKIGTRHNEVKSSAIKLEEEQSLETEKPIEAEVGEVESIEETEAAVEDEIVTDDNTEDSIEDDLFGSDNTESESEDDTEISDVDIEQDLFGASDEEDGETEDLIETSDEKDEQETFDGFNTGFGNDTQPDNWSTEGNESENIELDDTDPEVLEDTEDLFSDDAVVDSQPQLIVGQLLRIDELVWSDENINFMDIKYIGNNSVTYAINTPENSTNDVLLCKCIDAILAIEAYNGNSGVVAQLKQKDFSLVNNFLKLYTDEYRGYPRINGTKYVIAGIESIQQVATVLLDICNEMGIDTNEIFIYFIVTTNSEYIIENYGFPEGAIQLKETMNYESTPDDVNVIAVLKGDMFSNIVVTKNSLQVHKDIIVKALKIKTKYLCADVVGMDAIAEVVESMMMEAYRSNVVIKPEKFGNLLGTNHKLISDNKADIGDDAMELDNLSTKLYLSRLDNWQVPYALIKIHTTLFNNAAIAIQTKINGTAINFYGTEFETAEPSLSLAVKSFVNYVASGVKK